MPCYQINVVSLDFKAANKTLVKKAAEKLGLKMLNDTTLQTKEGRVLRLDGNKVWCDQRDQTLVNDLRIGYANAAVTSVATQLGWQKLDKGKNQYVLQKGW